MTLRSELSSFSLFVYSKEQRKGNKYKICIKPNVLINKMACCFAINNKLYFFTILLYVYLALLRSLNLWLKYVLDVRDVTDVR